MWKSKFAVCMLCITLVASGLSYNLGRDRGYYEGYGKASSEYQLKQEFDDTQPSDSPVSQESSAETPSSSSSDADSLSPEDSPSAFSRYSRYIEGQNTLRIDYLYTQANVHLRSLPSTDGISLDLIPSGTLVGVSGYVNSWGKVKYNGHSGYVLGTYLGEEKPADPNRKTYEELKREIHENGVEIIDNDDDYYDDDASETWVWISATGSKYHSRPDCGNMNPDRAYEETLSDAIDEGYSRCSNCW